MDQGSDPEASEDLAARPRPWRRRLKGALGWLSLALGLSVAWLAWALEHEALGPSRPPLPLASAVQARFDYPEAKTRPLPLLDRTQGAAGVPSEGEGQGPDPRCRFVQLGVTTPGDPAPHKVQILMFWSAASGPRPAVVVTPIFGGRQPLARQIGPALARRGVHAAVVLRAERYLRGEDEDLSRLERVLRTAVIDRRRTLDWLESDPRVDPEHLGALGISLGGLATSLLCATEPRIKAAVVALAGGDLGRLIIPASDEDRVREFVAAWAARGVSPAALGERIGAALPSDPLALAPALDPQRLLFVLARRDTRVPYASQVALWEAAGRPERYLLPTGHITSAVYAPYLLPACLDWLAARLEPKPAQR